MDSRVIIAVIGMGVLTYLPRFMPMVLLAGRDLPKAVLQWLTYLPPAILGSLVAQAVFVVNGDVNFTFDNPNVVPALITGLLAWRTGSLGWTVVGGLVAATIYNVLVT